MRELIIGVDSGTQSTKALIVNAKTGAVVSQASKGHELIQNLPPGAKEQHPESWVDATRQAIRQAMKLAKAQKEEIKAIGVSGQQHGFVPLDRNGKVIRPAKLWCDTTTGPECVQITRALGGFKKTIRSLGNAVLPGFTAPKILWLKNHEKSNFKRLKTVLLPHDYLNYWLTGRTVMEFGDASGTALLNVPQKKWSTRVMGVIDSQLESMLPELISSDQPVGTLAASTAEELGLPKDVVVSAGGGDNMMGAIGTGNTKEGVVTGSFGTSGTIYACSPKPIVDPLGEIAAFCDSTNQWLPLLCTMNVTVTTEMVRKQNGWTHAQFEKQVKSTPCGSGGLLLLPYLEGERTPNLPDATGVYLGINQRTFNPSYLARAAMEGVTLGMNYGLHRLRDLGLTPKQIRATGGGAQSAVWRQIMADVFNTEVVTLKVAEGAAYGAALQALWCWRRQNGDMVDIDTITDEFVKLNTRQTALPNPENVLIYEQLQTLHNQSSDALKMVFSQHRNLANTLA